jgi:8-oxo-dGTP diphosphatase
MTKDKSIITAVFSKNRDKILLIKRRDVPVWVLPGGGVEKGESLQQAAIRETLEETGFIVKIKKKVGEYFPINKLTKNTHLYECDIISGKAKTSSESKEVCFFPINKLPKYLPPPYGEWIQDASLNKQILITKKLSSITYFLLCKYLLQHPILVIRFLLSRIGLSINT